MYGKESMRRMATANILVCGLNGLGVEIGGCSWGRRAGWCGVLEFRVSF